MLKMTPTVLKNLFSKSSTRMYPFEIREPFPLYRGELFNDIDNCIFCKKCEIKCPSQCITVTKDKESGTGTWTCDPFACVYCGICVDVCPTQSLRMEPNHRKPSASRDMIEMVGKIKMPKKKKAAPKKAE
ncbi:4Fe-4S dicluster domain-containing protein [Maridesulfovibrio ferrireducens]|uniref:4Fe-4S dicluster domain-containing protein n=1 Tax=Maridesulfovibrio ferrireducens TaxID=246191 RepID=UPI001A24BD59|nr:4Fe-4S dicluster domain-containing protein [Maridesulfovibrio ferrireducens]MBI9110732.1 4Fe-4S dicluster domain-containing protein [Maridesulfovibrio ferrireducens]